VGVLGFSQHAGTRVAEVGFLLLVVAGTWSLVVELGPPVLVRFRRVVASVALALGGVLLIVAVRWGHFG